MQQTCPECQQPCSHGCRVRPGGARLPYRIVVSHTLVRLLRTDSDGGSGEGLVSPGAVALPILGALQQTYTIFRWQDLLRAYSNLCVDVADVLLVPEGAIPVLYISITNYMARVEVLHPAGHTRGATTSNGMR